MRVFRIELNRNPIDFQIVPLFDVHFGTVNHLQSLFEKVFSYIKDNDNVYTILGGDLAEFINVKDKRFDFSNLAAPFKHHVDNLLSFTIDYIVDKLYPIRDKILFAIAGNHENVIYKHYNVDVIKTIGTHLNIQYTNSYEALAKLIFKGSKTYSYDIYVHHGFGGGKKKGAFINSLEDISGYFEASCYIVGHQHQLIISTKPYIRMNNTGTELIEETKLLIGVGGFRRSRNFNGSPSYEERFGTFPRATGTCIISFDGYTRNKIFVSAKTFC